MPEHSTPDRYHAQPDEAFDAVAAPPPADLEIVSTQPPPDPDFKETRGRYRKDHDPRRKKIQAAVIRPTVQQLLHAVAGGTSHAGRRRARRTSSRCKRGSSCCATERKDRAR